MIHLPEKFDDLRPYYDSEIPAAMERIVNDPMFRYALDYLADEGVDPEVLRRQLLSVKSADQLQKQVMLPLCKLVTARTITELTIDGIANVVPSKGQLFISNHRDIVLDAFLQQMALVEHGLPASHVTFGSNLMDPQLVVDIGLSNKMFKTVRKSDDFQSFMDSSIHLSDYINFVVSHGESVWIAQRNGRTKDGFDKTEPGLLRMLLLGGNKKQALEYLNITPIAVSYQWEPCDIQKAVELYKTRDGEPYIKAKGEDLNSIITGIISPKGKVHISICKSLDVSSYSESFTRSEMSRFVKDIDRSIYEGYKLWDTNYVAYDILNNCEDFKDEYSTELRESFISRMETAIAGSGVDDTDELRRIYLKIYAGPVYNRPVDKR